MKMMMDDDDEVLMMMTMTNVESTIPGLFLQP